MSNGTDAVLLYLAGLILGYIMGKSRQPVNLYIVGDGQAPDKFELQGGKHYELVTTSRIQER